MMTFRTGTLIATVAALVVAAFSLNACDWQEGGYPRVVQRDKGTPPQAEFPTPAPPSASALAVGTEVDIAAIDLPPGVTEEMVSAGERTYGQVCVACHGPGGAGTGVGPPLDDQDWIHVDGSFDSLVQIIRQGVPSAAEYPGMMPPMGGANLDEDGLRAVAAYVYALSRAE